MDTGMIILFVVAGCFIALGLSAYERDVAAKRNKRNEEARYREQYVKPISLVDAQFGTMEAEYDIARQMLKATDAKLPQFGTTAPSLLTVNGFTPERERDIFRTLALVYEKEQDILQNLAEKVRQLMIQHELAEVLECDLIQSQIVLTEIEITYDLESVEHPMTLMLIAGVTIGLDTFALDVLYWSDSGKWEYNAQLSEGDV